MIEASLGVAVVLALLAIALEVVWRRGGKPAASPWATVRVPAAVVLSILVALGGLLKPKKKNPPPLELIPTPEFDDEPERKTDAAAANTDLDAKATDRGGDDLGDRADDRDRRLAELRNRSGLPD